MVDVEGKEPGQAVLRARRSLLELPSSPEKGTEMLSYLAKFQTKVAALRDDRGATAVEYGLMVALIAIVIIVAVRALGTNLSSLFNTVSTSV
jgi:pilus assembly protein Flp/PilA